MISKESTFMILYTFSSQSLLNPFFLAVTVTKRHWLLEESIGTMKMENEAYKTIWIVFSVTLTMFIVGPILLCSFFKKITTSFHLCHDVIAEEIEKEKAEEN
jgi:hypothetical protein